MKLSLRVLLSAAVLALVRAQAPYFVVYEAESTTPLRSEPLTDGFEFCPTAFAEKISLECVAPEETSATLFVNGVQTRREAVAPFTIAGDVNGYANPWSPPQDEVYIECVTSSGTSVSYNGRFECPAPSPSPMPSIPSAETTFVSSSIVEEIEKRAAHNNTNEDSSTPANITEVFVPLNTTEESPLPPVPTPENSSLEFNWEYCVSLPALNHTNPLPAGWVENGSALVYMPWDDCAHCIYPPETAVLEYNFTVPVAARYAITMESETKDMTEHNDGWIGFAKGITLVGKHPGTNKTSEITGLTTPQKAYHNMAGRYEGAFSVDGNAHSFSTTDVLVPGVNYTITFGARSTQFKFYGLFLFPCAGTYCYHFTDYFVRYLGICGV